MIRIGTAGWSLEPAHLASFPAEGSHLERYAAVFACAEINSSFHRPHRGSTYARWAAAVPPDFRFSVKVPKTITHGRGLAACGDLLDEFTAAAAGLGAKLGCFLVQLPPKLSFDAALASRFFRMLGSRHGAPVALEARHPSWFDARADALLARLEIARVAADPPRAPADGEPGGWPGLAYHRLHGSPRMYYSSYEPAWLDALAARIVRRNAPQTWCVFDNTAGRAAIGDALHLRAKLGEASAGRTAARRATTR